MGQPGEGVIPVTSFTFERYLVTAMHNDANAFNFGPVRCGKCRVVDAGV